MIPPKPKRLKSETFELKFQKFHVEGFSGEPGQEVPNGIEFDIVKLVDVRKVTQRKRR
jgi:hypothetical protein